MVVLLVMSTASSFAQTKKSWEEDSVVVLAQVEEFQLKIDNIRNSARKRMVVLGPVIVVSGVAFVAHAGVLAVRGWRDAGLFGAFDAFDNEIVQIEAAVFYGSGGIVVIQCCRIQIIELRRWLLLKPYERRYLELEDGYEVVPKDS